MLGNFIYNFCNYFEIYWLFFILTYAVFNIKFLGETVPLLIIELKNILDTGRTRSRIPNCEISQSRGRKRSTRKSRILFYCIYFVFCSFPNLPIFKSQFFKYLIFIFQHFVLWATKMFCYIVSIGHRCLSYDLPYEIISNYFGIDKGMDRRTNKRSQPQLYIFYI